METVGKSKNQVFFEEVLLKDCSEQDKLILCPEDEGWTRETRDKQLCTSFLGWHSQVIRCNNVDSTSTPTENGVPPPNDNTNSSTGNVVRDTVKQVVSSYRQVISEAYRSNSSTNYLTKAGLVATHAAGVKKSLFELNEACYHNEGMDGALIGSCIVRLRVHHKIELGWLEKVNAHIRVLQAKLVIQQLVLRAKEELQTVFPPDNHTQPYYDPDEMKGKLEELMAHAEREFKKELDSAKELLDRDKLEKLKEVFEKQVTTLKEEEFKNEEKMVNHLAEECHSKFRRDLEQLLERAAIGSREEMEELRRECLVLFMGDPKFVAREEIIKNVVKEGLKRRLEDTVDFFVTRLRETEGKRRVEGYSRDVQQYIMDKGGEYQVEEEVLRILQADMADKIKQRLEVGGVGEETSAQLNGVQELLPPTNGIPANVEIKWDAVPIVNSHRKETLANSSVSSILEQSLASFTIQLVNLREIRVGFFLEGKPYVLTCSSRNKTGGDDKASRIPLLVGLTQEDSMVFGDEVRAGEGGLKSMWDIGGFLEDNWRSDLVYDRASVRGQEITMRLEFLIGLIFSKVKQIAEYEMTRKYQNNDATTISQVVLVVPPRLLPFQRQQLKDSVRIAGFMESRIINATSSLVYDNFYMDTTHEIYVMLQVGGRELPQLEFVRYRYEISDSDEPSGERIVMEEYTDEKLLPLQDNHVFTAPEASAAPNRQSARRGKGGKRGAGGRLSESTERVPVLTPTLRLDTLSGDSPFKKREALHAILGRMKLKLMTSGHHKQVIISCEDPEWKWIYKRALDQLVLPYAFRIEEAELFSALRGGMRIGSGGLWEDVIQVEDLTTRCMAIVGPSPCVSKGLSVNSKLQSGKWRFVMKHCESSCFEVTFGLDMTAALAGEAVKWATLQFQLVPCGCPVENVVYIQYLWNREGIVEVKQKACECEESDNYCVFECGNLCEDDVISCISQMSFIFDCSSSPSQLEIPMASTASPSTAIGGGQPPGASQAGNVENGWRFVYTGSQGFTTCTVFS